MPRFQTCLGRRPRFISLIVFLISIDQLGFEEGKNGLGTIQMVRAETWPSSVRRGSGSSFGRFLSSNVIFATVIFRYCPMASVSRLYLISGRSSRCPFPFLYYCLLGCQSTFIIFHIHHIHIQILSYLIATLISALIDCRFFLLPAFITVFTNFINCRCLLCFV